MMARSGRRTLLTGATGFIGAHIATRLAAEGEALRCLVRASSDTAGLSRLARSADVEICVTELTDATSLRSAVAGVDRVVHAAAMVSDWGTVAEIRAANADATATLASAAVAAEVRRFVHISSTDVYGHPGTPAVSEAHRASTFANWYAETKREAEAALSERTRGTGTEAVILRPATVYGPGSVNVVGELAAALRGGYLPLLGGAHTDAGLVYVLNLVDAVMLALEHPAAAGESFNVSDELHVSWRRFSDDLARGLDLRRPWLVLPTPLARGLGVGLEEGYRILRGRTGWSSPPLLSRQAVQVLTRDQDFSAQKAAAVLGWTPRVDYPTGLAATLDWLRGTFFADGDG